MSRAEDGLELAAEFICDVELDESGGDLTTKGSASEADVGCDASATLRRDGARAKGLFGRSVTPS